MTRELSFTLEAHHLVQIELYHQKRTGRQRRWLIALGAVFAVFAVATALLMIQGHWCLGTAALAGAFVFGIGVYSGTDRGVLRVTEQSNRESLQQRFRFSDDGVVDCLRTDGDEEPLAWSSLDSFERFHDIVVVEVRFDPEQSLAQEYLVVPAEDWSAFLTLAPESFRMRVSR